MRDIRMSASPTRYPCTPKRPTAPRYTHCTTPSPPTCAQRSSSSKRRIPSSPLNVKTPVQRGPTRRVSLSDSLVFTDPRTPQTPRADDPLRDILRQRFQVRCLERAAEARSEHVKRRRYISTPSASEASSDGFDEAMDDDIEEDDDAVMQDELFRRIVASSTRKDRHSYRVSYALEVGSSFDPDMEDVAKWEKELRACPTPASNEILTSDITTQLPPPEFEEDEDEDEVAEYAEHLAALAELEDIPEDELFDWSDFEDGEEEKSSSLVIEKVPTQPEPEEDAMCIS